MLCYSNWTDTVCREYWRNLWRQTAKGKDWAFY